MCPDRPEWKTKKWEKEMKRNGMLTFTAFGSVMLAWALACEANPKTAEPPKRAEASAGTQWCRSPERAEVIEFLVDRIGYSKKDLAGLPDSVIMSSGGSGCPVAFAGLKAGETVVDLGCGGGLDCFLAAKRVGKSGKVIGVDKSPKALAAARENKRKMGAENVEFREGLLEKLPLKDESVDVAISNCVAPIGGGEAVALREAFRVLKPGGRLVTTTGVFDDEAPAEALPDKNNPLRRKEYFARLRAAGFAKVEIAASSSRPGRPWSIIAVVVATKL